MSVASKKTLPMVHVVANVWNHDVTWHWDKLFLNPTFCRNTVVINLFHGVLIQLLFIPVDFRVKFSTKRGNFSYFSVRSNFLFLFLQFALWLCLGAVSWFSMGVGCYRNGCYSATLARRSMCMEICRRDVSCYYIAYYARKRKCFVQCTRQYVPRQSCGRNYPVEIVIKGM